jgi:hypothetical protein
MSELTSNSREVVQQLIDEYKACEREDYPNMVPPTSAATDAREPAYSSSTAAAAPAAASGATAAAASNDRGGLL